MTARRGAGAAARNLLASAALCCNADSCRDLACAAARPPTARCAAERQRIAETLRDASASRSSATGGRIRRVGRQRAARPAPARGTAVSAEDAWQRQSRCTPRCCRPRSRRRAHRRQAGDRATRRLPVVERPTRRCSSTAARPRWRWSASSETSDAPRPLTISHHALDDRARRRRRAAHPPRASRRLHGCRRRASSSARRRSPRCAHRADNLAFLGACALTAAPAPDLPIRRRPRSSAAMIDGAALRDAAHRRHQARRGGACQWRAGRTRPRDQRRRAAVAGGGNRRRDGVAATSAPAATARSPGRRSG